MKSHNRTWLKAAAATVGAGALAFGGAVLPAAATESPESKAIDIADVTADKYDVAVAATGASLGEVKKAEAADELVVSDHGVYLPEHGSKAEDHLEDLHDTELPDAKGGAPISGTPSEGSRPGAPVTVYLDFDGETLEGTAWNADTEIASLDFAPMASADAAYQEEVWKGVAEDYAPFNVNVTTTDPGGDALFKTSEDDSEYGSHVIITDTWDETFPGGTGGSGIAWLGGTGSAWQQGAIVYPAGASYTGEPAGAAAKDVASTASHEAGHNFGLDHDGYDDGTYDEYYSPAGGLWGPLMGSYYGNPISQWSHGDYANATNPEQDDLATIADRSAAEYWVVSVETQDGEPYDGPACTDPDNVDGPDPGDVYYMPNAQGLCDGTGEELVLNFTFTDRAERAEDQVGDTIDGAAELDNSGTEFSEQGVIETGDDVDVFSFTTIGGEVTLKADASDFQPNLDIKLTLLDSEGGEITSDNPEATVESVEVASGLDASIATELEPGTYYATVEGIGIGDQSGATREDAGGYPDYGSLGNYTLSGKAAPFVIEDVAITSPEDGAEVTGGEPFEVTGTGEPGAVVTLSVGGETVATADVAEDGTWTASVDANQYGNTEVTATQALDGIKDGATASVTVTAPVDAPAITSPEDDSTTEDTTPTISGTGIPGAEVELTIVTASGDVATATATVDADGNWEYTPENAWEAGEYGVSAAQTINGVTSEVTPGIQFAIEVEDSTDDSSTDDSSTDDSSTDDSSTDDSSTDDSSTDDSSTDDSSTDGTGTDGSSDDENTEVDNTGTELAVTGAEIETAPIVMLALGLLIVGAGTAAFAIRQRKLSAKE